MAKYFVIYQASDAQIDFMKSYPETIANFIAGEPPGHKPGTVSKLFGKKASVPTDWPSVVPDPFDVEINHRNVDLYHILLNGSLEPVTGSGSIFQTWAALDHSAIDLAGDGKAFAFYAQQIPELLTLVSSIKLQDIPLRFAVWLKEHAMDDENPTADECNQLWRDIRHLRQALEQTVKAKAGLIWISK